MSRRIRVDLTIKVSAVVEVVSTASDPPYQVETAVEILSDQIRNRMFGETDKISRNPQGRDSRITGHIQNLTFETSSLIAMDVGAGDADK